IAPVAVRRGVVVAIAGQAAPTRGAVEGIAPGSVGDNAKILLTAEIIEPWKRRIGLGNDVLAAAIFKMSVAHDVPCLFVNAGNDDAPHVGFLRKEEYHNRKRQSQ